MFFGGGGFPFGGQGDDDEGFHEFMGGRGGGARGPPKEVDNSKLYKLLNVEKTATGDEIKKSFRKIALKSHPDKGGDPEAFKDITVAYEVLCDPKKRDLYDKHGEEGLRDGGASAQGGDIFDLFGMGGRGGGQPQKQKVKPIGQQVEVTLEDLYNGKQLEVQFERHRICGKCNGVGGTDATAVVTCKGCKGKGMRTVMMQLGPGMYSQRTGPCDECGGKGQSIDPSKMCKVCTGKKIKKETKTLKVEIDKGAPNGERYTIHGEGDEVPDIEAGDVIIQVKEKKHKTFQRKGADLFIEKEITLLEALTGLEFVLTHLDGRKIRIKNTPGDVIKPDQLMTVEGQGMPFHKRVYSMGNLIIQFKIKFPTSIDKNQVTSITTALGATSKKPAEKPKGEVTETVEMKNFEEYHRNTHVGGGARGNDSEEEEDDEGHSHGGQKVGCQSQ